MDKFKHIQGLDTSMSLVAESITKVIRQVLSASLHGKQQLGKIHPFLGSDKVVRDYVWVGDIVNVLLPSNNGGIFDGTRQPHQHSRCSRYCCKKREVEIEKISFPPHLHGKYQFYTCADMSWLKDYNFMTVDQYVNRPS